MLKNELLSADKIKIGLKTKCIGSKIVIFKSTSSTNDIAAEYAKNEDNDGLVVLAEKQRKGRGRAGSEWISGSEKSIICSIVLTQHQQNPELLSLAIAVAAAEAIDSRAKIKWPNDIILNSKKVAGILIESVKHKKNASLIIGIGINCHQRQEDFPEELKQTATSIDIESKTICDRNSVVIRLLSSIESCLETVGKDRDKIIERWKKLSTLLGQRITVIFNRNKFTGNCIGVDPEKGLILQLDKGGVRMFDAAHSSIAK